MTARPRSNPRTEIAPLPRARGRAPLTVLGLALLAGASCQRDAIDLGGNYQVVALRPPLVNPNIDVLFVVDDSGSMTGRLAQVAGLVDRALVDILQQAVSERPNLHIGVITTELGCGNDDGDGGRLIAPAECLADEVPYVVDVSDGADGRISNWVGSVSASLTCMTAVGNEGCGFEQPLGAVSAAMERSMAAEDGGFLREDALLYVVLLGDEDDCTAANQHLYEAAEEPFGLRDSFRCFEYGVTCDQPARELGEKTGCTATQDDQLLRPIDRTLDDLVAAKGGDANKVFLTVISGGPLPTRVEQQDELSNNPGWFTLAPSCNSIVDGEEVPAYPAPRLHDFAGLLPGQAWEESICLEDLEPAVARSSRALGDVAGAKACLHGDLVDLDERAAGLQPSCRASARIGAAAPRSVPACVDAPQGQACFTIERDVEACGHTDAALRGVLHAGDEPEVEDAYLTFECLTAESVAAEAVAD